MSPETFQRLALVQHGAASTIPFGVPGAGLQYALRNDDEPPVEVYRYRAPVFGFSGYALDGDALATCTRCHGADGAGGGAFPNLTLQSRDYLARTLAAYATGKRRSGYMQMIAAELSPQQIAGLSDHFAGLPRRSTGAVPPHASAEGENLALKGLPGVGLAACAACHGVTRAAGKAYPLLEGQARWYLANQMNVFRSGGRGSIAGDKVPDPMVVIARKLNERQILAVADYYAAQPPAKVQSFAAVKPVS